jgi:molecular chaperone GrpE
VTTAEPDRGVGPAPPDAAAAPPEPPATPAEPVTIRDKRKVSLTGGGKHALPEEPAPTPPPAASEQQPAGGGWGAEVEALRAELDERTRDLQRVTAEYANYRKRVDRDRALVGEQAVANVLSALLPVLDDLDRAREHGELPDGVAAIADHLVATTVKFGLTSFGERGDPFDPNRHEAVAHQTSPEVSAPTCVDVLRRGYLLGNRLLRPAMVAVADPEPAHE